MKTITFVASWEEIHDTLYSKLPPSQTQAVMDVLFYEGNYSKINVERWLKNIKEDQLRWVFKYKSNGTVGAFACLYSQGYIEETPIIELGTMVTGGEVKGGDLLAKAIQTAKEKKKPGLFLVTTEPAMEALALKEGFLCLNQVFEGDFRDVALWRQIAKSIWGNRCLGYLVQKMEEEGKKVYVDEQLAKLLLSQIENLEGFSLSEECFQGYTKVLQKKLQGMLQNISDRELKLRLRKMFSYYQWRSLLWEAKRSRYLDKNA
jgi:hypothetical protein